MKTNRLTVPYLCLCLVHCATSQTGGDSSTAGLKLPAGEQLLDQGGALVLDTLPRTSVALEGGRLVAWGVTEVPVGSRKQAAVAMVEAITRAEMVRFLTVQIASAELSTTKSGAGPTTPSQAVTSVGYEAVHAMVPASAPVAHGWQHIRRHDEEVLRYIGRLALEPDDIKEAISSNFPPADAEALMLELLPPGRPEAPSPEPASSASSTRNDGPSWAQSGDRRTSRGNNFVCNATGATEQDALAAAQAVCDDKICQLCGVQIEATVRTTETLTGVDLQRQVVQRCRRVRRGDTNLQHKSMDCGPKGCTAWIEIYYSAEDEKSECSRLASENFADPAECQNTIEEFRNTTGHSADSMRVRTALLDRAISACADIDVRPTPLIDALNEKLRIGMGSMRATAPRWLASHWLAPWGWDRIREMDRFVDRMTTMRNVLAHKALLLDVIEATLADTLEGDKQSKGLERLLRAMRLAPRGKVNGAPNPHLFAADSLTHRRKRIRSDLTPIIDFMLATYPVDDALWGNWSAILALTGLFSADVRVIDREWAFLTRLSSSWRWRAMQIALGRNEHGNNRVWKARFMEAFRLSQKEAGRKTPFKQFKRVMPYNAELVLMLEGDLPKKLHAEIYCWDFLWDIYHREQDRTSPKLRKRMLKRLGDALHATPVEASNMCRHLPERIALLEHEQFATKRFHGKICDCLTGPLADQGTRVNVTKSELFDRALLENLPCVQPHS